MEQETSQEQLIFDFHKEKPEILRDGPEVLQLRIGEFAGPLDLLLYLIKQEKANIFDIPIARITEKYLEYIRMMKSLDIAVAADFLVMAATLIEIKTKMLLPRDPASTEDDEDFEDPRKELVDRLLEYEKYKTAAGMLYERSTIEQAVFPRGTLETDENNNEISATVFDLLTVFQKIVARHADKVQMEIEREEVSLADMIKMMRHRIFAMGELDLLSLFEELQTRRELVTAFVAVLEIVRTETVKLVQKTTFGDIVLRKVEAEPTHDFGNSPDVSDVAAE